MIDGLKLDLRNLLEWLNGGVLPKSASWIDEERARAIADVVKWGIGILLIYILVNIVMTLLDQVQIPSEFVFKPLILISLVWILSLQYHNLKLGRWESPWKVCDRVMDKLCNPYIVFALGVGMIILQVTALWFQSQNLSYPLPLKMVEKDPNYILLMQDSMESFESTICDGGNSIYPGPVMGEKMWCQLNFSYKPNPKYKLSTVTVSGWTYQSNGSDLVQNFNLESGGSRFSVPLDQPHYNPLRFYFQVRKDGENQTDDNRSIAVDYSNFKTPQPQEIENEKKSDLLC